MIRAKIGETVKVGRQWPEPQRGSFDGEIGILKSFKIGSDQPFFVRFPCGEGRWVASLEESRGRVNFPTKE